MVKITISGSERTGKTSLAFALEDFLKQRGFNHVIVDDVDLGSPADQRVHGRTYEFNDKCLEAISNTVVIIQTKAIWAGYPLARSEFDG